MKGIFEHLPDQLLRGLRASLEAIETMANTASAKKAIRKMAHRTEINKSRRSRMRTHIRKVEEAISAGDKAAAAEALKVAQPEIMRSAQKGVLHKNTAARKVSRLSNRIKAIS